MVDKKQYNASSGDVIATDNAILNTADEMKTNPEYASRLPNMHRAFWSGTVASGTTAFFALDVPAGVEVVGFGRVSTVETHTLSSLFAVGGTLGTIQDTMDGFSFDERGGGNISPVKLNKYTTITGYSARTPLIPISPLGQGSNTTPSTQTILGAQPQFDSNNKPCFIYTNNSNGAATLHLEITWQDVIV
jgi:hypothetical protein